MKKVSNTQWNVFSSEDLEQSSSELLSALVRCYLAAAGSDPERYWAVVVRLGSGGIEFSSVRFYRSWEEAEASTDVIFAGLYGFGPVSGDVEPHAWNWAEAVMVGYSMYTGVAFSSGWVARPSRPAVAKRRQPKGSLDGRAR